MKAYLPFLLLPIAIVAALMLTSGPPPVEQHIRIEPLPLPVALKKMQQENAATVEEIRLKAFF